MAELSDGRTSSPSTAITADIPSTVVNRTSPIGTANKTETTGRKQTAAAACLSKRMKKCMFGTIIALMTCVTWVATSQLTKTTYDKPEILNAHFAFVYFSTGTLTVFYPLFLLFKLLETREAKSVREQISNDISIFGQSSIKDKLLRALLLSSLFVFIWDLTYYIYVRTLAGPLAVANVVAMFGCWPCFMFLLSWAVLHHEFLAIRVIGCVFTLSGAVLMTYKDGIGDDTKMWWFILTQFTAAGAAVFKVLSKKMIGDASCGQIALFLTMIGVFNFVTMWPILVILNLTGAELMVASAMPYEYMTGSIISFTVFQFLQNFGPLLTYDTFLELGVIVAIPICIGYDLVYRQLKPNVMNIIAFSLILFGYIILLMPSDWDERLFRVVHFRKKDERSQSKERIQSPGLRRGLTA